MSVGLFGYFTVMFDKYFEALWFSLRTEGIAIDFQFHVFG